MFARLIIISLFFFIWESGKTQIQLINSVLKDTSKKELFIGIVNTFEIPTEFEKVYLKYSKGIVTRDPFFPEFFCIVVDSTGVEEIKLYLDEKLIRQEAYVVKKLNPIRVAIGTRFDTLMTIKDIVSDPTFNAYHPDCNMNVSYTIDALTITLLRKNRRSKTFRLNGKSTWNKLRNITTEVEEPVLNKRILRKIKKLKSGDKIMLGNFSLGSSPSVPISQTIIQIEY